MVSLTTSSNLEERRSRYDQRRQQRADARRSAPASRVYAGSGPDSAGPVATAYRERGLPEAAAEVVRGYPGAVASATRAFTTPQRAVSSAVGRFLNQLDRPAASSRGGQGGSFGVLQSDANAVNPAITAYEDTTNPVLGTFNGRQVRAGDVAGRASTYNPLERNVYGRTPAEEFAEANRIRQSAIDATRYGAPGIEDNIIIPESPQDGRRDRALQAFERAGLIRNPVRRSAALRAALAGADFARDDATAARSQAGDQAALERARLQEAGALQRAREGIAAEAPGRRALADYYRARGAAELQPRAPEFDRDYAEYLRELGAAADEGEVDPLLLRYLQSTGPRGFVEGFADGGHVSAMGAVRSPGPAMPDAPSVQRYQQYIESARSMGLPPVPLRDFLGFQSGAARQSGQGGMAPIMMADGGRVPAAGVDVSGRQVVDPDPNAPTDSIPAVIDGERPAALDSDEFVFPKEAVMFYGLDKLYKMIEKAKQGATNGANPQPTSAIQAAAAQ